MPSATSRLADARDTTAKAMVQLLRWGWRVAWRARSWAAALLVPSSASAAPVEVQHLRWADARWVVAVVDLTDAQLELVGQRPGAPQPHTLARTAQWVVEQGRTPVYATNAGIYTTERRPLGLHIEAGRVYRPVNRSSGSGNFYLKPNGVFFVGAGGAGLRTTEEIPVPLPKWSMATQSGPILVRHGQIHPRFLPQSHSRKARSWIGVRDAEHVVIAVSLDRVRFYDAATFARDRMGCSDALYLDGTISEYWLPERASVEGDPQGYGAVLVVSTSDP